MAEDPTPIPSLKARIAALNLSDAPDRPPPTYGQPAPAKKRPPPPPPANPPPRLTEESRSQTANNPPQSYAPTNARPIGNQPAGSTSQQKHVLPPPSPGAATQPARPTLPPRPSRSLQPAPAPSLPPRRPSEQSLQRKESQESISTIASSRSVGSALSGRTSVTSGTTYSHGEMSSNRVKAPPFDPSKLPPLPPKRTQEEKDADLLKHDPVRAKYLNRTNSSTSSQSSAKPQPPSLPSRPSLPARPNTVQNGSATERKPRRSALEWGLNKSTEQAPALPTSRPGQEPVGSPPPIPLGSRPDLSALQASKPKPAAQNSCLKCRDFRAVDAHAARFPREAIPSHDLSWLAHQLTDPFSSLTDKARALFTWLHHNIDYNVVAFFNNNVQPSTPASTIATGLAVCEGYAGLFTALATTIGLESVVIGGHGKGYGYSALPPGAPVPPFNCGHAWNAVRIDNGEWKLIDCCWGAGHLGDGQSYKRKFSPECFCMDNNEFGLKHFPENPRYFFRTDGRASIPWEEYIMAPPGANVFGHAGEAGLSLTSFQPQQREIKIHDPSPAAPHVVRFMFEKRCPHYDSEAIGEGKPYMFFLTTEGKDGRNKQFQPMDTDGRFYWKDVERLECGAPGQRVMACVGDKWNGGPDGSGRGVTRQMWEGNRYGFRSYAGVAVWELT